MPTPSKTFPRLFVVGIPCATDPTFRPVSVLRGVRGRNLVADGFADFQIVGLSVVEHQSLRYTCLRHLRMNPRGRLFRWIHPEDPPKYLLTVSTRISLHCKRHFVRYIFCIWVGSYHPFLQVDTWHDCKSYCLCTLMSAGQTKTEPPANNLYLQAHEKM